MIRLSALRRPLFYAALFVGVIVASAAAATPLAAQDPATVAPATVTPATAPAAIETAPAQEQPAAKAKVVDFITPHITDSHFLELPWVGEVALPRFAPFEVGPLVVDMSITKHVVFMMLAALLAMITLIGAAMSSTAGHKMIGRPKGFAAAIEALALNLRNEVILPNVGEHGEKYVPFTLTLFFFILFCNLLGLIPYGSTPTGNISVTLLLAILTFLVVEITGILTLKGGYLGTIIYWNKDLPMAVRIPMAVLMTPIELLGKLTKPFALTIRLFANMTAGHIVLLAIIGLIFTFGSYWIAAGPVIMAVAISVLELFVAFLQAFIFTLLASVFIGQMRVSHH
ncbi:MAG: F0F1 ATP synthase subunit A [Gemmatimonas sp.]